MLACSALGEDGSKRVRSDDVSANGVMLQPVGPPSIAAKAPPMPMIATDTTEADLRVWLHYFAFSIGCSGGRYVHLGHAFADDGHKGQEQPARFLSTEVRADDDRDGWLASDPVVGQIRMAFVPFIWSAEDKPYLTEVQRLWLAAERARGVNAGIAVPVQDYAAGPAYLSLFGLDRKAAERLMEKRTAELAFDGVQFHAVAKAILPSAGKAHMKSALTAREIECLRLAARGRTVVESGQALGITGRTVEFHLKNAADKLGVPTKLRAVALAVSNGLIDF